MIHFTPTITCRNKQAKAHAEHMRVGVSGLSGNVKKKQNSTRVSSILWGANPNVATNAKVTTRHPETYPWSQSHSRFVPGKFPAGWEGSRGVRFCSSCSWRRLFEGRRGGGTRKVERPVWMSLSVSVRAGVSARGRTLGWDEIVIRNGSGVRNEHGLVNRKKQLRR